MGFHTIKHNRDLESKPKLQAGFIFEAKKPFENVCATGACPEGIISLKLRIAGADVLVEVVKITNTFH